MNFGSRLKELRKSRGLNQGELAKQLNISQQQISCYEKGTSTPEAEFLSKVATFFGVSIDFLLLGRVQDDHKPDEQVLLQTYRKLPPDKQNLAKQMIGLLDKSEGENE